MIHTVRGTFTGAVALAVLLTACAGSARETSASDGALAQALAPGFARVVVVRHAEKAPTPANDPVLSAIGIARATALDSAVRDYGITDVVVSHLQRTRLTAAAVIARVSPTLHVVPIGGGGVAAHARAVADTVRAIAQRPRHGGVLVVGHSNTVTPIVEALGGGTLRELCDSQYSQFFEVQLVVSGPSRLRRVTYGAADPVDATCAGMAAPR